MGKDSAESFEEILERYRKEAGDNKRSLGDKFERLMKSYLKTDPICINRFKSVWLWSEFPQRKLFGDGNDIGIDIVAQDFNDEYTAVQCKCYQESSSISKDDVDTFITTSGKQIEDKNTGEVIFSFSYRLWIATTDKWSSNAKVSLKDQKPPVNIIGLSQLRSANVDWNKVEKGVFGKDAQTKKKEPFEHQEIAIQKAQDYFQHHDRGKLIMACGTGKTFTSLKIAEKETGGEGTVLFLVPSIALLGQTLNEWVSNTEKNIHPICICSDPSSTKKQLKENDEDDFSTIDLALPASTKLDDIKDQFNNFKKSKGMIVFFSTYQSIGAVSDAQKAINEENPGSLIFDLVICDEAHRTTGVMLNNGKKDTAFTSVHQQDIINAKKRMYMTATPRLYTESAKAKAKENKIDVYSMDDEEIYGEEIHRIGFGDAVEKKLLSDYKVLVLTVSEKDIPSAMQRAIASSNGEINIDQATQLVGCINALSKRVATEITFEGIKNEVELEDPGFMHKAVAFCSKISESKDITDVFNVHGKDYYESLSPEERAKVVSVKSDHVDGTMGASRRDEKLAWLNNAQKDECRILTNVRCLSEGVDVPSLDAILFLSAKNSQVDVVQSVGRVMRKADGKKFGYIIIPVIVPSDVPPEKVLDDNKYFKVVWTVLNALRAHDDRFNAEINKIELNKKKPGKILTARLSPLPSGPGDNGDTEVIVDKDKMIKQLCLDFGGLQNTIYAKMVQKVGDRHYFEQWAESVAKIADEHTKRISGIIESDKDCEKEFNKFLTGLKNQLNPSVTKEDAIEMLAQHLITRPVFDALFEGYPFVDKNPVSQTMQEILKILDKYEIDKEQIEKFKRFYENTQRNIKRDIGDIDNAEGKQKIILELYEHFFKAARPKVVKKYGIVYTPVEVVDFIINSVADVLKKEFGRTLSEENVHILDPFTGTGTFIVRLLQSGLIKPEDIKRKYLKEIHANEIVLLAYYIASINIENAYHGIIEAKDGQYESFEGICLTDTFQTSENDESPVFLEFFPKNSERVEKQKKLPLTVILGNPPYSIGQDSENDNAKNQEYEKLDRRVAETYSDNSGARLKRGLYDSYIRAFRWASDRLSENPNGGVIGFITGSGWLDGKGMDGFRQCLENEFSTVYVFNLRGGIRAKRGDLADREGENVFDIMAGVAITILVKNPVQKDEKATIYYRDIGDYLERKEKFEIINKIKSVLSKEFKPEILKPNKDNDWINKRSELFQKFLPVGDKDATVQRIFDIYSGGVITSRDAWCYNYSKNQLKSNMKNTIDFYNSERKRYLNTSDKTKQKIDSFVNPDSSKISWSKVLKDKLIQNKEIVFTERNIYNSLYRPFCSQFAYINKDLTERRYQMPKIFPTPSHENICICVSGAGGIFFDTYITDKITDIACMKTGNGLTQCFPLYWYEIKEDTEKKQGKLFDSDSPQDEYIRHDGITDFALQLAREKYGHKTTKEDLFYYIYGLLQSPDYRTKFAADLKKMLPHIPFVDSKEDFLSFSKAGRKLAELHLNYETQNRLPCVEVIGEESGNFKVAGEIKFKNKDDKSEIIFNDNISIIGIPNEAHDYSVNGRTPIEWILERYQVKTDKVSQITNDPNDWAAEHENPRYILDLLLSVITVSVETVKIIDSLPKIDFKKLKA